MPQRTCSRCGISKPETIEFFQRNGQYFYSICKECCKGIQREKRQKLKADPQKYAARKSYDAEKKREYRAQNTPYSRRQRVLSKNYYHLRKEEDPIWYASEVVRKRELAREKWAQDPQFRKQEAKRFQRFKIQNPQLIAAYERASAQRKKRRYRHDSNYAELVRRRNRKAHSTRMANDLSYRAKHRAKSANYSAHKRKAMPGWLNDKQLAEIEGYYLAAASLTVETGEVHEVDHIIPLQGTNICGLHVPWNLRVVSRFENRSKRNELDYALVSLLMEFDQN